MSNSSVEEKANELWSMFEPLLLEAFTEAIKVAKYCFIQGFKLGYELRNRAE